MSDNANKIYKYFKRKNVSINDFLSFYNKKGLKIKKVKGILWLYDPFNYTKSNYRNKWKKID